MERNAEKGGAEMQGGKGEMTEQVAWDMRITKGMIFLVQTELAHGLK